MQLISGILDKEGARMLVHGMIPYTEANGPGKRAIIHLAGCDLACPGCWNPETHLFDTKKERNRQEIVDWVLNLKDIDGLCLSGGEPMQQAPQVLLLLAAIHAKQPKLSINMFTGYTTKELESGRFRWKSAYNAEWVRGTRELWLEIKKHLDFAITGRYVQSVACHEEPLRGSRNQEVLFFNDRYKESDLSQQIAEVSISGDDALVQLTGYPTLQFLDSFKEDVPTKHLAPVGCSKPEEDDNDDLVGV